LLDAKQVQEILGLGKSIVYALIRSGEIKHMKIRGKIRVPRRFLVEYLNTLWYCEGTTDAGKLSVSKEVNQ
jgi:excisionase family DNA binding protein